MNLAPPNNTDIERDFLRIILSKPNLFIQCEDFVDSDCFYNSDYRLIFEAFNKIHKSSDSFSLPLLTQYLMLGRASKEVLAIIPALRREFVSERGLVENGTMLSDLKLKREFLIGSYKIIQGIERSESTESLIKINDEISHAASNQFKKVEGIEFKDSSEDLINILDNPSKGLSGITTGLSSVNIFTDGWQNSDIILIGARTGMGKSISGIQHAYSAARENIPVAFVSLELPKYKITARIIANLTKIPYGNIGKGKVTPGQKDLIKQKLRELNNLPLYYYDYKNSWDVNDLNVTMRNWARLYGIKLIVIDYVQLLRDRTVKSRDKVAILTEASIKLKQLQSSLEIPIIEIVQLNRQSINGSLPSLEHIKECGQFEQDASTIILLHRQDYYDRLNFKPQHEADEFIPTNDLKYIIAKNREGETGVIDLKCLPQYNLIYEDSLQEANTRGLTNITKQAPF